MIQIDGPRRHVCIKLRDNDPLKQVLLLTEGQAVYRHTNGEISMVRLETAGLETRRVLLANLQTDVPEEVIRKTMARFGEVKDVHFETWSYIYRYEAANGFRIAAMTLAKHIPSNITIALQGASVLQGSTDYVLHTTCHETGHLHQVFPIRRRAGKISRFEIKTRISQPSPKNENISSDELTPAIAIL